MDSSYNIRGVLGSPLICCCQFLPFFPVRCEMPKCSQIRTLKPVLSNKVMSSEKITLVENDDILENDKRTATVFNNFFSNIITNLDIPQYIEEEPISQNIDDPLMKALVKYRNHPRIVAIKGKCDSGLSFSFSQVERDEIMKEINNLKRSKAIQSTNIPTKLIKENCDIFCDFTFENFNSCVLTSIYPSPLKNADITPVFKKVQKRLKTIIGQ